MLLQCWRSRVVLPINGTERFIKSRRLPQKKNLYVKFSCSMVHSAAVASGEDILILQPLVPQSSLNKFNMVGFVSNYKNISVFSLYGNREKFSAQTTGLLFRNNHKMPRKKMKTATFTNKKRKFNKTPRKCLNFRIRCINLKKCWKYAILKAVVFEAI